MRLIHKEIVQLKNSCKYGKMIKDGVRVTLAVKTDVGKSSLLNALIKKERAIVTEIAGTTRDIIEEAIEYKGIKIIFTDTAGIRNSKISP